MSIVKVDIVDLDQGSTVRAFDELRGEFEGGLNSLRLGTELKLQFNIASEQYNGVFSEQQFFDLLLERRPDERVTRSLQKLVAAYVSQLEKLPEHDGLWSDTENGIASLCYAVKALAITAPCRLALGQNVH